ncbi:hypothetical protein Tco_0443789, partial [Tanacetum coccineum]
GSFYTLRKTLIGLQTALRDNAYLFLETDFQEKEQKKAKSKRQNRARNGKDKVKSQPSEENTT